VLLSQLFGLWLSFGDARAHLKLKATLLSLAKHGGARIITAAEFAALLA
jgi:hypothetical protein